MFSFSTSMTQGGLNYFRLPDSPSQDDIDAIKEIVKALRLKQKIVNSLKKPVVILLDTFDRSIVNDLKGRSGSQFKK